MCHCPVGAVLDYPRAPWGLPVPDTPQLSRPVATPPNTPGRKRQVPSGVLDPSGDVAHSPASFTEFLHTLVFVPVFSKGRASGPSGYRTAFQPCLLRSRAERRGPAQSHSAGLRGNAGGLSARLPTHVLPRQSGGHPEGLWAIVPAASGGRVPPLSVGPGSGQGSAESGPAGCVLVLLVPPACPPPPESPALSPPSTLPGPAAPRPSPRSLARFPLVTCSFSASRPLLFAGRCSVPRMVPETKH